MFFWHVSLKKMDKSWISLSRACKCYYDGIETFINFVRENKNVSKHICPCRRCTLSRPRVESSVMRKHLIDAGMLQTYRVWTMHGEIEGDLETNDVTVEMLNDVIPQRDFSDTRTDDRMYDIVNHDYAQNKNAFENYCRLLAEADKPIFPVSPETVLNDILSEMDLKVSSRWSDKSFDNIWRGFKQCCLQITITKGLMQI